MTARSGTSIRHPTWAEAVFSTGLDANPNTRNRRDRRDAAVRTPRRAGHHRRLPLRVRRPRHSQRRDSDVDVGLLLESDPPDTLESRRLDLAAHIEERTGRTSTDRHPQSSPVRPRPPGSPRRQTADRPRPTKPGRWQNSPTAFSFCATARSGNSIRCPERAQPGGHHEEST